MSTRYHCRECGREITKNDLTGVRIRNACHDCQAVTTFERA